MATTLQAVIGLSDKLTSDLTTPPPARGGSISIPPPASTSTVFLTSSSSTVSARTRRACAELPLWNEKMGRWVNRGAHGIALIDTSRRRPRLRYVFDVSDTHLSRTAAGGRCACGPSGQTSMRLSPKSWSACTRMPASPA